MPKVDYTKICAIGDQLDIKEPATTKPEKFVLVGNPARADGTDSRIPHIFQKRPFKVWNFNPSASLMV